MLCQKTALEKKYDDLTTSGANLTWQCVEPRRFRTLVSDLNHLTNPEKLGSVILFRDICMYVFFNMVYGLLHYLHYNSNTTSLVHLFGIVVIFVIEISFTQRLTLQMILS